MTIWLNLVDEKNDKLKESLGKKVEEYLNRAEQLKTLLAEGPKKKAAPAASGGGSSGGGYCATVARTCVLVCV
jgi:hypothetical protein